MKKENAIAVNINKEGKKRFPFNLETQKILSSGNWRLDKKRRHSIEYIVSCFDKKVICVYKVISFSDIQKNRTVFETIKADSLIQDKYIGKDQYEFFTKKSSNPIKYINIGF